MKTKRLISPAQAAQKTTLSRTTINIERSKGAFPQDVRISDSRIAFDEAEIDLWCALRIEARNKGCCNFTVDEIVEKFEIDREMAARAKGWTENWIHIKKAKIPPAEEAA